MTITQLFLVLVAFQCFSLAGILMVIKKGNRNSNRSLSAVLVALGIHMTLNYLDPIYDYQLSPFTSTLGFLYGPLIWRYVNSLTHANQRIPYFTMHFVPFVVANVLVQIDLFINYLGYSILLHFSVYLIFCFLNIRNFNWIVRNTTSHAERYSLRWLTQFIGGIILIFSIDLIRNLVIATWVPSGDEMLFTFMILLLIGMLLAIVYRSINFPEGVHGGTFEHETLLSDNKRKYANSDLGWEAISAYAIDFQEVMATDKPFRNSELNLDEFSKVVDIHPRIVSQVINQAFNTNFSDWVNDYRVGHATKLLTTVSKKEMNITQIFYDSGFSSKSSFYATFLKKTGQQPKTLREN